MTMTNAARGAAFERRCRDLLTADGWHVVRSAGSRGVVDLYAMRLGQLRIVQCKINGRLDPEPRAALCTLAVMLGATPMLAKRIGQRTVFEVVEPKPFKVVA